MPGTLRVVFDGPRDAARAFAKSNGLSLPQRWTAPRVAGTWMPGTWLSLPYANAAERDEGFRLLGNLGWLPDQVEIRDFSSQTYKARRARSPRIPVVAAASSPSWQMSAPQWVRDLADAPARDLSFDALLVMLLHMPRSGAGKLTVTL